MPMPPHLAAALAKKRGTAPKEDSAKDERMEQERPTAKLGKMLAKARK